MDTIILENFRCFAGRHEVPVRPLTLLVGENSSGKTTLLAAVRTLQTLGHEGIADFNEPPFQLGAFNDIVNVGRGRAGQVPDFFSLGVMQSNLLVEVLFENETAQPRVRTCNIVFPSGERLQVARSFGRSFFSRFLTESLNDPKLSGDDKRAAIALLNDFPKFDEPYVSAPIRAEPKRNFELTSDRPKPHGSHVPVVLSQIYGQDEWDRLAAPLLNFAKAAGLFSAIKVRPLGKKEGDPFQLQVQPHGRLRNIIDVGYGVSQILPLVFDMIRGDHGRLFMVQQPEVHLHPRAQAELGSLFAALVKSQSKRFMVETHSDYIVDRIRMDVRDKRSIRPEDVMILFFEMGKDGAHIHPIEVDEQGNLVNVPASFREFFLNEERRFLGV